MTDKEVTEMLLKIKSVYQNFTLNDGVLDTWIEIFKDYEYEPIMLSLNKYIRTNEYCPVPASILKLYEDGKAKVDKAISDDLYELIGILSILLDKVNVLREIEHYKHWIKSKSVMRRMTISKKVLQRLRNMPTNKDFDFIKWLDESGDLL